jgi:hypothetical protein
MALGLFAKGDSGAVQIDENYHNLSLIQKSTVATTANLPGSSTGISYYDLIVPNCVAPVLALTCALAATYLISDISGSTYTFRILVGNPDRAANTAGTAVTYYLFDAPLAGGSGFGLKVFKADGSIAFNSNYPPMRVVDFWPNYMTASGAHPDTTYAPGTYAWIVARGGGRAVVATIGVGVNLDTMILWLLQGAMSIPNGVAPRYLAMHAQIYAYPTVPPPPPYGTDLPGDLLIIDVTNF